MREATTNLWSVLIILLKTPWTMQKEKELIISPVELPNIHTKIEGCHVLIVI